jgi:GNAT superfamily N-acetyltransferase
MVHVRRARPQDSDAIAGLTAEAARDAGASGTSLDAERVRWHGFGSNALFEVFLAKDERTRTPIGHAIITKGYDVRRALPTVVLCELFVREDRRRAGVARELMSAVARRASEIGARELSISTGAGNEAARRFFAAVGAKENQTVSFVMTADGIQWLAAESR